MPPEETAPGAQWLEVREPLGEQDLVLNPAIELELRCRIRRRDQPLTSVQWLSTGAGDTLPRLVDFLAGAAEAKLTDRRLPAEVLAAALRLGILVPEQQVPPAPPAFHCELGESLLPWVPDQLRARFEALVKDRPSLRFNPRLRSERAKAEEGPAAGGADFGPSLWSHLDGFQPMVRDVVGGAPTLWTAEPGAAVELPYWPGDLGGERLREAMARQDLTGFRREELLILALAGVVVAGAPPPPPSAEPRGSGAYFMLGRVLSPLYVAALRRYYRQLKRAGLFVTDERQVPEKRDGIYCDVVGLFLQKALEPAVSAALGARVLPSYTWVFRYRPGASLQRHVDRPQCRWNVSLCLDAEGPAADRVDWPLFFEVDGRPAAADLDLGEAVLYSGTETPHWRDPLPPDKAVTMAFLHYVDEGFSGKRS